MKEEQEEEALDPKRLFDPKEYITLIIGREGFTTAQNNTADLIEELLGKDVSKDRQDEIYLELKKVNATEMLIDTLKKVNRNDQKATLASACWESGLDFTHHFLFFVELAFSPDYPLALEAITVLDCCEGNPDEHTLKKAKAMTENLKSENTALIDLLKQNLVVRMDK